MLKHIRQMITVSISKEFQLRVWRLMRKIIGFDLRPFLYPSLWNGRAFKKIDELVERIETEHRQT